LAVILGGLVAALFGEWQAGRRFRRELELDRRQQQNWIDQQFWNRKAETYSRICELLWDEMAYAKDYEDYIYDMSGDAKPPKSREDWEERREFLRQQGQIGGIFLSEEAVEELKQFNKDYSKAIAAPDLDVIVEDVYSSAKSCLDAMLLIAQNDLQAKTKSVVKPTNQ
jgi:hypothetical protein